MNGFLINHMNICRVVAGRLVLKWKLMYDVVITHLICDFIICEVVIKTMICDVVINDEILPYD